MANEIAQFEISDNAGRTEAFSVTATTTPQSVPAVAGEQISGFLFSIEGRDVEISTDGGTSYFPFPRDAQGAKDVKGEITQLSVRTSAGSATVNLWIDFEDN